MIDKQVDAEGLTESRSSRQAAANATDDGMRIAEIFKLVVASTNNFRLPFSPG